MIKLWYPTVISQDLSVFYTGQIEWDVIGTTTHGSFKNLIVALISIIAPQMYSWFWFSSLLSGGSYRGFSLAPLIVIVRCCIGQGASCVDFASCTLFFNDAFWDWRNNCKISSSMPYVRGAWAKTPLVIRFAQAPTLTLGHSYILGLLELVYV